MKVTTKGQVTIPQHIRRHLRVEPHAEVDFLIEGDVVILVKVDPSKDGKDRSRFATYRGSKSNGLSTNEWMAATRGK